jgi:hypothetical protein
MPGENYLVDPIARITVRVVCVVAKELALASNSGDQPPYDVGVGQAVTVAGCCEGSVVYTSSRIGAYLAGAGQAATVY